jgi:choline dehydrogenase-like flavoprotein
MFPASQAYICASVQAHVCPLGPRVGCFLVFVFPQAVVNSRLQVKGIEGLRVVDASIMPTTGNNHASWL